MKLQVALHDFVGVLKKTRVPKRLGKRNLAAEMVVFRFDGRNLHLEVVGSDHFISAAGCWSGSVEVPLASFRAMQKVFPVRDPVELCFNFSTNKLEIESARFPATRIEQ